MMRIRRMVWIVVLLALACGAIPAAGQGDGDATPADLRRLLSDPGCQAACFLGIEPGITTNAEVEAVFAQANIAYELGTIGLSNNRSYVFDASSITSYFYDSDWQGTIWAGENEDDTVWDIILPLRGISVNDVLNLYGAPARVSDVGVILLVYPIQHIAFEVDVSEPSMIDSVELAPLQTLTSRYLEQGDILPCTEPAKICSIPTATPTGD